jgi:uncharacterized protein (DUF433 family)
VYNGATDARMECKPMVDEKTAPPGERVELGAYIVSDPEIYRGAPTFRGTRIMVWQVLEQLAQGIAWEEIEASWHGEVPVPAIREAAQVASLAFKNKAVSETLDDQRPDVEIDWRQLTSCPISCEDGWPEESRIDLGAYVVADARICHGKPTFRGTRIMAWQVLEETSERMTWEEIEAIWRGKVPAAAVRETIVLAAKVFRSRGMSALTLAEPLPAEAA